MALFTTREAAEESRAGDPFVLNGVVRAWQVRRVERGVLVVNPGRRHKAKTPPRRRSQAFRRCGMWPPGRHTIRAVPERDNTRSDQFGEFACPAAGRVSDETSSTRMRAPIPSADGRRRGRLRRRRGSASRYRGGDRR